MQNIYLPSELACKLIELEVGTQEEQGLNRDSILQLLDCYTVLPSYSESCVILQRKGR